MCVSPICTLFENFIYLFIFGRNTQHAGSQFPDQGSNPCPLQWKRRVLTIGLPRKSHALYLFPSNEMLSFIQMLLCFMEFLKPYTLLEL